MSQHTEGPWRVSGIDEGPGERHLHIGSKNSMMVMASMNPVHLHTIANARLIAAAPEMYEALKAAADFIESHVGDPDMTPEMCRTHAAYIDSRARIILAKARGEA